MTIAISVKVHDGVVLAADSASTLFSPTGGISHVYNNANKILNLYKSNEKKPDGLPIGVIVYGLGGIGNSSISTLIKDFRKLLMDNDLKWKINVDDYKIEDVANKFKKFIYEETYKPFFKNIQQPPFLGFIIAGYSSKTDLAEEWRIEILNGECIGPAPVRKNEDVGITWGGESKTITRLVLGYDPLLPNILAEMKYNGEQILPTINFIQQRTEAPIVPAAMPIQDAIDLAKFLVETTENFTRFLPVAPTVGGPVEIATITKHEGFKWILRKHYYDNKFNQRFAK
jgi:hypothetical protein